MGERKKMKNKIICLMVMTGLFLSCSQRPLTVRFPTKKEEAIPFKKFEKIFLSALAVESPVTDIDPKRELIDFFTVDFQRAVKRKVEYLPLETGATDPLPILKEKLKNFPDSLLITGKLSLDIKSRSIIKDIKNKKGKKQKKFVKIEMWEIKLKVRFIETETFEILKEKTFSEKSTDADPEKTDFNFKSLFDRITDRLILNSTRQVKMQERYLLNQ